MKRILCIVMLLITSLQLQSQNEKIIKKTIVEYNTKKIDQISLDAKLIKRDVVKLSARIKTNPRGEVIDIETSETSNVFHQEVISMFRQLPKLYGSKGEIDIIYSVDIFFTVDSAKKIRKRINKNKNIDFEEVNITSFYDINESEIFDISEVDNPPIYRGCGYLKNKEDVKKCLNKSLSKFVSKNFSTRVVDSGEVEMMFVISKSGEVINIKAESKNRIVEKEGVRVISLLSKFKKPGKIKGESVYVKYKIPLTFRGI